MRYLAIEIPATPGTWSCHAVQGTKIRVGDKLQTWGYLCRDDISRAVLDAAHVLVAGDYDCWRAYVVPGDHADDGAASAAWAWSRATGDEPGDEPKPIARGVYRYDEDGVAPVSVGVEMMEVGR